MEKAKNLMLVLAIVIMSCYAIIVLGLFVFQDYFIFFPRKLYDNSYEVLKYKAHEINLDVEGITLHGWLLNKDKKKLIIYYGGNAEEVSANISDMINIEGYSVLLMNYRGYGLSEGKPSEKTLFDDALYIYDRITGEFSIQPENVILFGRSLGSGVAVYVASKRKVSKLILITPYDSIRNIAQKQFPIIPVGLILRHPFNSMLYVKDISSPTLIVMGGRDRTIPNDNSMNLVNGWKGDCESVLIEEADHNDIHTYPEYWDAISKYLNQ